MDVELVFFFFFNDTATTEIYTLSLHDALPICGAEGRFHAAFLHFGIHRKAGIHLADRTICANGQIGRAHV